MSPTSPLRRPEGIDLAWLAVFALVLVATAAHHELGLDEAQAWNISRAARLPWDVVPLGRYDGHTPLWHLVLWPLALGGDPRWMQALGVAVGVLVAALLLRDRPVPRLACVLILFGFFVGYRYTLVPRTYVLTLLLSAVLASAMFRGCRRFVPLAGLCGMIAFTGAFGALLSAALMALVIGECLGHGAWRRVGRGRLAAGALAYLVLAAAATYFVVFPIPERASFAVDVTGGERVGGIDPFRPVVHAVFPLADRWPFGLGERVKRPPSPEYYALAAAATIAVGSFAALLRGWRAGQLAWLVAASLLTLGCWFIGFAAERFMGCLVIAALVLVWVRPPPGAGSVAPARTSTLPALVVALALVYHAAIGLASVALDLTKEISNSRSIADFVRDELEEPYAILTAYAFDVGPVMAYLDRAVYDVNCECWQDHQPLVSAEESGETGPSRTREHVLWCALVAEGYEVVALFPDGRRPPDERHEVIGRFAPGDRTEDEEVLMYRLIDPSEACAGASGLKGRPAPGRAGGAQGHGTAVGSRPSQG